MTEGKKNKSWEQALERVMKQQRELDKRVKRDYSLPEFNDPARLREWMNVLGINQSDLAREAHVSQQLISQIESGRPFSEPSRKKIWQAIDRLRIEQDLKKKGEEGFFDSGRIGFGFFKTPMELKDEEISQVTRERDLAREQRDTFKQLVDMNLVDRCVELEKQLAAALQANADYVKLFALKAATVAGDELQQEIEARQREREK